LAAKAVRAGRLAAVYAVSVAVAVAMAVSLPKVAREIYWMRHPQFYEVYDDGRWPAYRATAACLRRRADRSRDRCRTPKAAVMHYWSGVRCVRRFTWQGVTYDHFHALPAEAFARAVVDLGDRFVVVQMDEGAWSRNIVPAMAATGVFTPPERFGDLALFERSGARPEDANAASRKGAPRFPGIALDRSPAAP
jgi:hypothetical protein